MGNPAEIYFVAVVTKVFDQYFQSIGAERIPSDSISKVSYIAPGWFADVLFLIDEEGPRSGYCPRIEIGCIPKLNEEPCRQVMDICHTVPSNNERQKYNLLWKYNSAPECESIFIKVRDEILDVFAKQYLENPLVLRELISRRNEEINAEWLDESDKHHVSIIRNAAELAYYAREFQAAIDHYQKIPPDKQTKLDQVRMKMSLKFLTQ